MKKKLFTLLSLLMLFVCGVNAQTYKNFTETTVFYTNETTVAQAYADGWIYDGANGGTFSPKSEQTMTIDPETDGEISAKYKSLTIKQANTAKAVVVYVKGVTEVKAYTKNTNSTEVRTMSMDITVDGATTIVTNPNSGGTCVVTTSEALDATKEYKILFYASGDLCLYAVKFIAPSGPSTDATIKSLTVNEEVLTATGSAYSIELPNSYQGATAPVVITPNSDKAIVTVSSDAAANTTAGAYTATVSVPSNVTITVTPESGDAAIYTLNITKAASASADNSLSSVTVDGTVLTANEDGNYTMDVPYAYTGELLVVATATDDAATVEITDNNPTVEAGASATVTIKVTAESGAEKAYTVTITRTAASTACELNLFTINGFVGTIDGQDINVKTIEGYDFSHTPMMSVSSLATAVWDAETKKVTVTAENGATSEYTVVVASEAIQPYKVEAETTISFAAAAPYTPAEWIYGTSYNEGLQDLVGAVVGGYDLAKESEVANIASGRNLLNVYLAKCATLAFDICSTGSRTVVATIVGGADCGTVTLTKKMDKQYEGKLICTINSDDPVVVSIRAYKDDTKAATTGGTRFMSMTATPYQGGNSIDSEKVGNGISIYTVDGMIHVSVATAQLANVYSIDGRLVRVAELAEGDNTISGLAKGMYLVNNQKVVIK